MKFEAWYEATYGSALVSTITVAEAWAEYRFSQMGREVDVPEPVKVAWYATASK